MSTGRKAVEETIRKRIEPLAPKLGAELVAVEWLMEDGQRIARIFIDSPNGVDMRLCERFHRSILDLLEDLPYDYLEVTSCGDRPFQCLRDYQRAVGKKVELRFYVPHDHVKVQTGTLLRCDESGLVLETKKGERPYPYREIALARIAFEI